MGVSEFLDKLKAKHKWETVAGWIGVGFLCVMVMNWFMIGLSPLDLKLLALSFLAAVIGWRTWPGRITLAIDALLGWGLFAFLTSGIGAT